jgi:hypothetical protein
VNRQVSTTTRPSALLVTMASKCRPRTVAASRRAPKARSSVALVIFSRGPRSVTAGALIAVAIRVFFSRHCPAAMVLALRSVSQ